jgi:hypothetical protein
MGKSMHQQLRRKLMSTARRANKRDEVRTRRQSAQRRQRMITIIIIALAVIAVAIIILLPYMKPPFKGLERPQVNGNSMGDPNAPVKVEEFSDFQCPYCRMFTEEKEADFVKKYIATGKVYFTYIPYSFLGQESVRASEAAYCALDQNKFWEYHDILFANQGAENAGVFNDSALKGFAQNLRLNMSDFNSCFTSGKYTQKVMDDVAYGQSKKVNATPYFIVNDNLVDMGQLDAAVDAALQGK